MGESPGKRTAKGISCHTGPRVVVQSQVPPLCSTQQPRSHAYACRSRCLQRRWTECAHEKPRSPRPAWCPEQPSTFSRSGQQICASMCPGLGFIHGSQQCRARGREGRRHGPDDTAPTAAGPLPRPGSTCPGTGMLSRPPPDDGGKTLGNSQVPVLVW